MNLLETQSLPFEACTQKRFSYDRGSPRPTHFSLRTMTEHEARGTKDVVWRSGVCDRRVATKTCIQSTFILRALPAEKRAHVRYRFTDTDHMHTHTTTRATRRALQGGVLDDDADDGASAAPVARAPAARLCAARAVQVVELEVPVGGARGEQGRPRGGRAGPRTGRAAQMVLGRQKRH